MLATLESVQILDTAERIAKMILNSDVVENYRQCLYKMKTSSETQEKIERFTKLKEQYEYVQRFGRYHPDYQTIMKETRLAKREMDMDENVANFKRAETELQNLLDEISLIIGRSVSESVKVETGNPFFETKHKVGCSTGGSCGCSA
ncbi:YlbF family regulator [Pallidibacillus thermolactis]|uniref:YlbF family regulator n=1 Tax=Pallidibacillus thermolactis TaxID=251051 RepID=UPI0021DA63C6|nr:YlbF family regulator [Pallidibacillus thermolactis]MCU9600371.1 YlbF family regulator [Pallidibacillus thermolactis subsp. kokeshiiformis]